VRINDIASELARLEQLITALRTGAIGPKPPVPPSGNEIVTGFEFSTSTPAVTVFGAVLADTTFSGAAVLITEAFDDLAAVLQLGTTGTPTMLLGPADSRLSVVGCYSSDTIAVAQSADVLLLKLSLGTASAGRGYVFFRQLPP
jgi:hypothetical protein